MKPHVTTREKILEQALQIAQKEGVDKVSIRKLANACGIAIGSVYNYYSNKQELIEAVSKHFWSNLLKDQNLIYRKHMGFTLFLQQYYAFIYGKLSDYDTSWLTSMDEGMKREALALFKSVLLQDDRVNPRIWNMELNQDFFCDYVFDNIIALLQSKKDNCRFYIYLLEHLLYGE